MAALWRWYVTKLSTNPLPTKIVSSGIVVGAGDVIAQLLTKETTFDYKSGLTAATAMYGALFIAPYTHYWLRALNKMIPLNEKKNKLAWLSASVAIDQLTAAPFAFSVFLTFRGWYDGKSVEQIKDKFRNDFVSIYAMGLKIWGPTQFVNFYFVPLDHRVMFLNMVSLVWNSYLAAAAGSKKTSSAESVQITSK